MEGEIIAIIPDWRLIAVSSQQNMNKESTVLNLISGINLLLVIAGNLAVVCELQFCV
jgi:hypothetical protein